MRFRNQGGRYTYREGYIFMLSLRISSYKSNRNDEHTSGKCGDIHCISQENEVSVLFLIVVLNATELHRIVVVALVRGELDDGVRQHVLGHLLFHLTALYWRFFLALTTKNAPAQWNL